VVKASAASLTEVPVPKEVQAADGVGEAPGLAGQHGDLAQAGQERIVEKVSLYRLKSWEVQQRTATRLAASIILTSTPRFANRRNDPSPAVLGGGIHRPNVKLKYTCPNANRKARLVIS
jgi:hypothetical protein